MNGGPHSRTTEVEYRIEPFAPASRETHCGRRMIHYEAFRPNDGGDRF